MTTPDRTWDVFVSYAREDAAWVRGDLCPALRARRTLDGRRPEIFLDVDRDGIPPATDFMDYLAKGVQRSRRLVAVYSTHYFRKEMCDREVTWALSLHPNGSGIVPILLDPAAASVVPFKLSHINWLPVTLPDWFDRLCEQLDLAADRRRPALRLLTPVGDVMVNNTLPVLRVRLVDEDTGELIKDTDSVTVTATPVTTQLQGTLAVAVEAGIATFDDLSFTTAIPEAALVVESPGCQPVSSTPFAVVEPERAETGATELASIDARGTPFFFPDSTTLSVLEGNTLGIFGTDGQPILQVDLSGSQWCGPRGFGRQRLSARGDTCLAMADWSGHVVLVSPGGLCRAFDLSNSERELAVPGALCFAADRLYVGMWNGTVWALALDGTEPERILNHAGGVQALTVVDDQLVLADLDGKLAQYTVEGLLVRADDQRLESVVLGMRALADCVIVVGERRVYRYTLDPPTLVGLRLPLSDIASTTAGNAFGIVLDAAGKGLRFNSHLTVCGGFHTTAGAEPISVDRVGEVIVFAYPGGWHVLVVSDRVVFGSAAGPMAISPDGTRIAVAHAEGIRIDSLRVLLTNGRSDGTNPAGEPASGTATVP